MIELYKLNMTICKLKDSIRQTVSYLSDFINKDALNRSSQFCFFFKLIFNFSFKFELITILIRFDKHEKKKKYL